MRFIKILIVALSAVLLAAATLTVGGQQHWCETTDVTWPVAIETTDGTVPTANRDALCDTGPPVISEINTSSVDLFNPVSQTNVALYINSKWQPE